MKQLLLFLIHAFKLCIRPFLGGTACRFYPTCSEYALEAVRTHGPFKGSWLSIKRLARCHPFSKGGYDPSP